MIAIQYSYREAKVETKPFTQMNVRIGAQVKQTGDEALSSIGFTPTQAVRALWTYAAQRGKALEEVKQFLLAAERGSMQAEPAPSVLKTGWQIIPNGMVALGISAQAMAQATQDEVALIDDARVERAKQKGWL